MKKRWTLFQIIAGLLIVICFIAAAAIVFTLYRAANHRLYPDSMTYKILYGFLVVFLIVGSFMSICIFLIYKKYPDKEITAGTNILFNILLGFYFLPLIAAVLIFIYGSSETYKHYSENTPNDGDYYGLLTVGLFLGMLIYTIIAAVKLRKSIRRNFEARQDLEINSLGENQSRHDTGLHFKY